MNMRLVVITELIAPYRIPVFNALARHAGVDLHVIFLSETDAALRAWRIYREEICFSYEVLPSWRIRIGRNSVLLNRCLSSSLRQAEPGAVLCGGYNYPASWGALIWARKHKIPFVLWSESNQQDKRAEIGPIEFLKRYFVRRCQVFAVPGKSSSAYLRDLGVGGIGDGVGERSGDRGLGEKPVFVAPNAVDNSYFAARANLACAAEQQERQKNKLPNRYILCVARLVREKGIFDLLEAYGKLESNMRAEVGLVFAGDGPARGQLMRQAQKIKPGHISFPGFVQREELAILYALAELMVLPTHSDPWGLVVNEAMACGLPVIVTDVAGCCADLVEDGCNGYVVPPRDSTRLKEAIERVLLDRDARQQMGRRSAERMQHSSPGACAAGLAAAAFAAVGQVP